ncbi:MAG: hypothetical protein JO353_02890 [Phycisphaerae bacterium]|nr:hypothetical protein [Phycisphaerae bacterium]
MLVDVAMAGLISLATGAMTEGYLLATISIHLLMVYLYLSIVALVMDVAEETSPYADLPEMSPEAASYAAWAELVH